jgi:hypothetical protein
MEKIVLNDIVDNLSVYRFENFLNTYTDENGYNFYNLLRSINIFPAEDSSIEDEYFVELNDTWLLISYKYYGTIYLWWLVCEYNRIDNPTNTPEPGTKIKLLKRDLVWNVISYLNKQNNN